MAAYPMGLVHERHGVARQGARRQAPRMGLATRGPWGRVPSSNLDAYPSFVESLVNGSRGGEIFIGMPRRLCLRYTQYGRHHSSPTSDRSMSGMGRVTGNTTNCLSWAPL